MDKKAAVELSMTTIIIIVIVITILSLGLVWIRSVFSDVGELTSGAFEQGETQIAEIFGGTDQPVALSPSETTMSQDETTTATLAINNLGGDLDQGSALGTYACVITGYNLPDGPETTSLIINIEN